MKYALQTAVLPELSASEVLETLRRHGYDGVEWRVHEEYHVDPRALPDGAKAMARAAAAHGLEIACLMGYAALDDLDLQKRTAEACAIAGCRRYRPGAVIYDGSRPYRQLYTQTVDRIGAVIDAVSPFGVKPLIETHFGTLAPSPSAAYALVRHFDSERIGVNFDPANQAIEGREAWKMGLEILGPYLDYVHAKNVAWERHEGGWRWTWAPLNGGMVDWPEIMSGLASVGYDGWVSNENFFEVPLRTRGFAGEDLTQSFDRARDIDERLAADLAYLRRCRGG